jgi:hypothetical protein
MKQYGWKILLAGTILIIIAMGTLQGCAKLPSPTVTSVEQGGVQGAAVYVGTTYPKTVPIILSVSNYIITAANGGQVVTTSQINSMVLNLEASSNLTIAEKNGINVFLVSLQPVIATELASAHLSSNSNITIELCWVAMWASNILGGSETCNIMPTLVTAPTTS